jgi:hypothetical protein
MNSYQPQQQQQPQYRPNRAALWVNTYKNAANQPDYKGNIEISWALLQELTAAFNAGQYDQDRGGQPCIKLDFALYAQQAGVSTSGRAKPILSGQVASLADTQRSAQARQQGQGGAAQQPAYQQPQQFQQPAYQQPAQPAPAYQQPQQPASAPQPAYPEQPQAPAPAPAYQQPAPAAVPQAPAPMPQQPAAPVYAAPPPAAPVAPMPGAIHGQPAPTLPQGF